MLLDILLIWGVGGLVCRVYMYRQAMYVLLFYKVARNGQRPELCQLRARQKSQRRDSMNSAHNAGAFLLFLFCFCCILDNFTVFTTC